MNWQTIITIICATGIPSAAFTFIIRRLIKDKEHRDNAEKMRIAESERREKAIQDGVCALLRTELQRMHEVYVKRGAISSQDFSMFQSVYKPYHALGGNDIATVYLDDIQQLPIRD